jgi:glycosyltransferase involved in cell wall biosynthesis
VGPLVSVVIPACEATPSLERLLEHLEGQTLPREEFEIVIGDDGPRSGGLEDLALDRRLRISRAAGRNSYAARNGAARLARAPILAFVDSDCEPEPAWLANGLRAASHADVVGGMITLAAPARPTVWTRVSLDSFHDQEMAIKAGRGLTGNLFVRREVFESLGGFDDSLPSGGDVDFVRRCVEHGASLAFAPDTVVRHATFDRGRALLRRIWFVSRWRASRVTRRGGRPYALRLRWWFPIVSTLRARRRDGRPLRLDRARLHAADVSCGLMDEALALGVVYLVIPYVSGAAQIVGWCSARRTDSLVCDRRAPAASFYA